MTQINNINGTAGSMNIDGIDLKNMSPFTAAALVQLEIAKTNKDTATQYINEMKAQNDRARQYMEEADKLRQLRSDPAYEKYNLPGSLDEMKSTLKDVSSVKNTYVTMEAQIAAGTLKPDKNGLYQLPAEADAKLRGFVDKAGHDNFENITRTADNSFDNYHFKSELDGGLKELEKYEKFLKEIINIVENGNIPLEQFGNPIKLDNLNAIISSLEHQAENCNSDNQTQMVKLQDKMGQYNSYISGSSDMIKTGAQLQQSILKS